MTDHGTIKRLVGGRSVTPAAVTADDADGVGELVIASDGNAGELVELDWEEFFDRMDSRDAAVAVSYDEGRSTWSFDVLSSAADRSDEELPTSLADRLSSKQTDDPSKEHYERATDQVNLDNHRDEEPFES